MSRAEDDAVAMSEDSSDSDSDFEEIEASEEDMQAISGLEAELQANPNLYDKHIEVEGSCLGHSFLKGLCPAYFKFPWLTLSTEAQHS